jgi:glycosyltransferase involved in cell wall biosynthesis
VIRSSVDCNRLRPQVVAKETSFTIGWIGSPITAKFLLEIAEPLAWANRELHARILLIGSGEIDLASCKTEIVPWTAETEVDLLQSIDVGVMPLPNTPFERGKCGYKLVQYMACGKPVIASPVGINREIVTPGLNGYLPTSKDEWQQAFKKLFDDRELCSTMGRASRERALAEFSLMSAGAKLATIIKRVARNQNRGQA